MDLQKIGTFLRDCRKEKGLTQEQLAETLNISRRTVSRWETGSNLPDLDLLIEMSDLYQVDLRELLDGERKNERMNEELKETVLQVAAYSSAEKQRSTRIVRIYFVLGIIALIANAVLHSMDANESACMAFLKGFSFSTALVAMVFGILYTTGAMLKIQAFKLRLIGKNGNKNAKEKKQ